MAYQPKAKSIKKPTIITYNDFQAYSDNGALKQDIIKAFLCEKNISAHEAIDQKIRIEEYDLILILHPDIKDQLKRQHEIKCLISCQFRQQGHYAIAIPFIDDENHAN